jgi:rhamnulokinase
MSVASRAPAAFAAMDLGASNVRLFSGRLDGGLLVAREEARAPNRPVRLPDGLHWDVARIYQEMLDGLARLARQAGGQPVWAGVDGWGVDYGLLDAEGRLLGLPFHYRDARTDGLGAEVAGRLGPGAVYQATGIQEMDINTVFQLVAERSGVAYAVSSHLLLVPDLIGYFLTGQRRFERTNSSTTQLVDARTGGLVEWVFSALGLRRDLFAPPVLPGERLGPLLPEVAAAANISSPVEVVAVASHDTASAVLAVPATGDKFAYVSSGTWTLVGLELEQPVITEQGRQANFSNELGVDGTVRFLRNAMGHWMLQECERTWAAAGEGRAIGDLLAAAARRPPFRSLIDTGDPEFAKPGDMPARVRAACAAGGQPAPEDEIDTVRCIVDSMALAVASTLDDARECSGRDVDVVHVVGGGVANELFLATVAAAAGLPVVAGPVEASAIGNLLVQLRAAGQVGDRADMRALVAESFPVKRFSPAPAPGGQVAAARRRLEDLALARSSSPAPRAAPTSLPPNGPGSRGPSRS